MSFFRNPEIRRSLLWWLPLCAVPAAGGWALLGWQVGLWTGAACLGLAALHYAVTARRYAAMAALSRDLDRVLHGGSFWEPDRFREGELAILQDEIAKLVLRLQEQADALQREKCALADAMADISHQIRTPLTSLRLVASLLSDEGDDEARRLALTRELHSLLGRIDWLIEGLLKLSRLDAGAVRLETTELPAAALLERASAPLAVALDLRNLRLEVDAAAAALVCDPSWTAEAIGNILKNCMEHTPPGGTIRAEARQTAIFTELTITDTGPGIAPEDLPHLFERFYRGKDAAPAAAGVGLALARTILTSQGATVQAKNGIHGGAKFVVRFYRTVI